MVCHFRSAGGANQPRQAGELPDFQPAQNQGVVTPS